MLQSLMVKPSPKALSSPRSPTKKNTPKIPELVDLQSQIILKRPNNVTQFIRDWANSKLNKFILSKNDYEQEDDDDEIEFSLKKGFRAERRFALCVDNSEFNQSFTKIARKEKLEETKSVILIKLKSMDMIKGLSNQILWELVEDFEEKQYKNDQIIIQRKQPVQNFYIIISGCVSIRSPNRKNQSLSDGDHFGEDSLLFGTPSPYQYASQGVSRVAHLEGRRISNILRNKNIEKYKLIYKSLQKIDYFRTLHDDQMEKIAEIAMNQSPIYTETKQEIDMDSYASSLFIVTKGLFYSYSKKLTNETRNQHSRQYKPSDTFGLNCLKKELVTENVVSQDYGAIIQIKSADIEKAIGPLLKLQRRKRRKN